MKKTLFAGLLLLLVVSLIGIISCTKSAATSTTSTTNKPIATTSTTQPAPSTTANTSATPSISGPQPGIPTPSLNIGDLTSSASTGFDLSTFDWSTIPVYPDSVRATDLETPVNELVGVKITRIYVTDIANQNNIIDYYHSELPKNGWSIYIYSPGANAIWAHKGSYSISVAWSEIYYPEPTEESCQIMFVASYYAPIP